MARTPSPGARSAIVIAATALVLTGCATNRAMMSTPVLYTGVNAKPLFTELSIDSRGPPLDLHSIFRVHGMLDAYWETLRFALPDPSDAHDGTWRRWIDTSLTAPEDVVDWDKAPTVAASSYLMQPRSLALLVEQEVR